MLTVCFVTKFRKEPLFEFEPDGPVSLPDEGTAVRLGTPQGRIQGIVQEVLWDYVQDEEGETTTTVEVLLVNLAVLGGKWGLKTPPTEGEQLRMAQRAIEKAREELGRGASVKEVELRAAEIVDKEILDGFESEDESKEVLKC